MSNEIKYEILNDLYEVAYAISFAANATDNLVDEKVQSPHDAEQLEGLSFLLKAMRRRVDEVTDRLAENAA